MIKINIKELKFVSGAGDFSIYPHKTSAVYGDMLKHGVAMASAGKIGSSIVGTSATNNFGCDILGGAAGYGSGAANFAITKNPVSAAATGAAVAAFVTTTCNTIVSSSKK